MDKNNKFYEYINTDEHEQESRIGEYIKFDEIVFIYKNCTEYGYEGNAWISYYNSKQYGPCINRHEVFQMLNIMKELIF